MYELADLASRVVGDVVGTFARVWPFLLISVLAAVFVSVYVGTERVSKLLNRRTVIATGGAVLFATLTPFCSCGTTAVLLGMLATATPWAPLVAFMVASPLTSPSGLLDRAGWLNNQARIRPQEPTCTNGTCQVSPPVPVSIGPGTASIAETQTFRQRWKIDELLAELWTTGRKLVLFFIGFTAVGYLAIEAIPTDWLTTYLGGDSLLSVPLAAVLGIPAYINTEASLPLVATLMDGGMGPGPAMAFLVTGAGTSIGAISGLFVIARIRIVGLVVALLFAGAIAMGWIAQIAL
jgi:uncharacterized membrane protein YraQ (UPF0718 family)